MTVRNSMGFLTKPIRLRMFTRTALIGRPRPRQSSRYAACAVRFISARAAIIRYRRRRRTQTAKRARFGLASSTYSVLSKPLRVVGSYGRLALLGQKPKSASRTSPTTSAVLSRWSAWLPHEAIGCPARPKRAPGPQNTAYSRQTMSQNHHRAAPAIDPTKNSSLFEVPFRALCNFWGLGSLYPCLAVLLGQAHFGSRHVGIESYDAK